MIKYTHFAALGGALAIAACATGDAGYEVAATGADVPPAALQPPPSDLAGTVIRAATVDGDIVNRVHFYPNGVIHIVPEDGAAAIEGTYAVRDDMLCLDWAPRGTECWPYTRAFQMGETVTLTSNLGQMARVTMVDDDAGLAAAILNPPATATAPPPQTTTPQPTYEQPAMETTRRAGERG